MVSLGFLIIVVIFFIFIGASILISKIYYKHNSIDDFKYNQKNLKKEIDTNNDRILLEKKHERKDCDKTKNN